MTPATDRGPARLMKGLGQCDVQHINRTDRRTGTLFEGRFRSADVARHVRQTEERASRKQSARSIDMARKPWSAPGLLHGLAIMTDCSDIGKPIEG
jgi:hypothetical protein